MMGSVCSHPDGCIEFRFHRNCAAPRHAAEAKALRAVWTGILATVGAVGLVSVAASLPKQYAPSTHSVCRLDLGPSDEIAMPLGRASADYGVRSCSLTGSRTGTNRIRLPLN
jgi:hypothetical protein